MAERNIEAFAARLSEGNLSMAPWKLQAGLIVAPIFPKSSALRPV